MSFSAGPDTLRVTIDPERLAGTVMEMIDVPSPTGSEQALAELLYERFQSIGLRASLQEVEAGESNVVGILEGHGSGATLMLLGHLDTTWSGSEERIAELGGAYLPEARRDGDWIYGMGAYNMKSGLATAIEAVNAIVDSGCELNGNLIIAGVVGESPKVEVGSYRGAAFRGAGKGARFLANHGGVADCCVIAEPTNNQISIASGGYVFVELVTRGYPAATYLRRGVSGESRVVNAIEKMRQVVSEVERWGAGYTDRERIAGKPDLHVSLISFDGGLAYRPSKQPALCRATIEIGTRPRQPLLGVVDELKDLVRDLRSADPDLDLSLNVLQTVPGAEVGADEYVVEALVRAHREHHGTAPELTEDGWLADTSHLTRYGIPSVCYGPAGRVRDGGAGYYAQDGEQCYLPDLVEGAAVFARLALDVCSSSREEVRDRAARDPGRFAN